MRFTVVMPSYLGKYAGAAKRREEKIVRAVNSVVNQTFEDWELWVIADGCQDTIDLMEQFEDPRIHTEMIKKAPFWDGAPRNKGIERAEGEYIVYLDIDDAYGMNHLQIIDSQLKDYDWVFFNDYTYQFGQWFERVCDIKKLGMNGTSNVCHRKSLNVKWGHRGYAHDHHFNQKLLYFRNHAKIETPEYFVMHIPGRYDV